MKPFVVALVAGLITTALPIGTVERERSPPAAVAAPAATDAVSTPATSAAASGDSSRYRFYNGYWWYWTPDNHWVCYVNGQWVNPSPPVQASSPVQAPARPYQPPLPSTRTNTTWFHSPYDPYPYGYSYPYPYYGGGLYLGFGGGYGGYWHGGYGGFHH